VRKPAPPEPPPPPPEPAWIATLRPAQRAAARALLSRLEDAGIGAADEIARAEMVEGEPAIARVAVRRAVAAVVAKGGDAATVAAGIVALMAEGGDDALGVRWRLVDDDGRPIGDVSTDP
jgi:hypothetical protein